MKNNRLAGFMFYESYMDLMNDLTGDDFKEVVNAIMSFICDDIEPDFNSGAKSIVFKAIRPGLQSSKERYMEKLRSGIRHITNNNNTNNTL